MGVVNVKVDEKYCSHFITYLERKENWNICEQTNDFSQTVRGRYCYHHCIILKQFKCLGGGYIANKWNHGNPTPKPAFTTTTLLSTEILLIMDRFF